MEKVLLVAAGGATGAVARYLLGTQAMRLGSAWPYGTFAANILGGFLMGMLVGYLAFRGGADQERLRLLLGVGVLGGFTTFSAYSLELTLMLERKAYGQAVAYGMTSVLLSIAALAFGAMVARRAFA
jgi:CrcB protein